MHVRQRYWLCFEDISDILETSSSNDCNMSSSWHAATNNSLRRFKHSSGDSPSLGLKRILASGLSQYQDSLVLITSTASFFAIFSVVFVICCILSIISTLSSCCLFEFLLSSSILSSDCRYNSTWQISSSLILPHASLSIGGGKYGGSLYPFWKK